MVCRASCTASRRQPVEASVKGQCKTKPTACEGRSRKSPSSPPRSGFVQQLDSERRLTEAEERVHLIQSVVEQGFSAVLITGGELPDPRIVYINPAFAKATGYSAQKVVGQPLSALASLTSVQDRLCAGMPRGERFVEEIS